MPDQRGADTDDVIQGLGGGLQGLGGVSDEDMAVFSGIGDILDGYGSSEAFRSNDRVGRGGITALQQDNSDRGIMLESDTSDNEQANTFLDSRIALVDTRHRAKKPRNTNNTMMPDGFSDGPVGGAAGSTGPSIAAPVASTVTDGAMSLDRPSSATISSTLKGPAHKGPPPKGPFRGAGG